jgi:exodeoxyribonuclease III
MKKIVSYNVNGIRAAEKKGFFDWMKFYNPDILCVQETKAQPDQLDESWVNPNDYHGFWHSAEKKGYSGVAIFTKEEPKHIEVGCGIEKYDKEGRILRADYDGFSMMCVYLPSGSSGDHRQEIKEAFMDDFYEYIYELKQDFPNLIIAGDINICHREIDIHDPVSNKKSSGFLPHEREWLTKFLDMGFVDSFRHFNQELHNYSWWSYRARARAKNKGWRLDYQFVSETIIDRLKGADILSDVVHSDHCPVEIEIDF